MNLQYTDSIQTKGKTSRFKAEGERSRRTRKLPKLSGDEPNELGKDYREWLDKDRANKDKGLVSQTILEEDDSSDVGF